MTTIEPIAITATIIVSFLIFYTGYSKAEKRMAPSGIFKVLFFTSGINHTMDQVNKLISLAGLTQLGLVFLVPQIEKYYPNPYFTAIINGKSPLIWHALIELMIHAVLSLIVKYKWNPIKIYTTPKWFAVSCGQTALITAEMFYFFDINNENSMNYVLLLGMIHFVLMEQDSIGKINCRPFAWVSVMIGVAGLSLKIKDYFQAINII